MESVASVNTIKIIELNKTEREIFELFKEMKKPLVYMDIYQYFAVFDRKIGNSTVRENMINLEKKQILKKYQSEPIKKVKNKKTNLIENRYGNKKGRPNIQYELNLEILPRLNINSN